MSGRRTRRMLDTMTVSSLMSGEREAVQRLSTCSRADVFIPQPVMAEITYGIVRLPVSRRKDRLQARFDLILNELQRADWNDYVSFSYGGIKADLARRGVPLEDFDIAIAAHAAALDAILVTHNLRHMERIAGLQLESWAQGE